MSSHTYHPDSHTHGLADGCPRCAEHATHPFETLDAENLFELIKRIAFDLPARSDNERRAMDVIEIAQQHARQLDLIEHRGKEERHAD